jgi:transcriptional regulator with XRE-family HTH domain
VASAEPKTQYYCVIKKRLGQRIAELRKAKGLTQEKLAEKADYSVEFISFVERGVHSPSIEGCARIAKALGIKLKDLKTAFKRGKTSRSNR